MRIRMINPLLLAAGMILISSCASTQAPVPVAGGPAAESSAPPSYNRPHRDGAPWWDVDVSQIPDAVPTPHLGRFKASPYTVLGQTYYPISDSTQYQATGTASWYGTKFHGQATANGESYDLYGMTAAHKTLPLPSYVRVTSLDNGRSVVLRVNDRGPFYSDRIIDLSFAAAKKLGFAESGTARVKVEGIDPNQWWAQQGRPAPLAVAKPAVAAVSPALSQSVEVYTPPAQQHAGALLPVQIEAAPGAALPSAGLFVQVGAFANPDAAELLKARLSAAYSAPVFVSPVARGEQVLHRVRLGPIRSEDEALRLQGNLRQANLGQPTLVRAD